MLNYSKNKNKNWTNSNLNLNDRKTVKAWFPGLTSRFIRVSLNPLCFLFGAVANGFKCEQESKQLIEAPLFAYLRQTDLPIPQRSLLPAVTACCQNFSNAETPDFFLIHSCSAAFSSFILHLFCKASRWGARPVFCSLLPNPSVLI